MNKALQTIIENLLTIGSLPLARNPKNENLVNYSFFSLEKVETPKL